MFDNGKMPHVVYVVCVSRGVFGRLELMQCKSCQIRPRIPECLRHFFLMVRYGFWMQHVLFAVEGLWR